MTQDATPWGIRAGKTGDADQLFLNQSLVALGWAQIGSLEDLEPTREAFKERYANVFPDVAKEKPGSIPPSACQLVRFVHEVKVGDFVAYPAKKSKQIHLGKVARDGPPRCRRWRKWAGLGLGCGQIGALCAVAAQARHDAAGH